MGPVAHWDRRRSQHWSCQRCFQFCFIVQIRDKTIFCIKIFRPIKIREKIKFNYGTCCSLGSTEESTLILSTLFSILFYRPNPWQNDFLYKNFSTNQNSRKNQIELWDLLLIGIDGGVNTDPVNVVFTFVLSSKSVTMRFFCIKIFWPIRIREKIKLNYGTCCSLGSTEERTLILRTSFSHLFYRPNPWQSVFFV